MKVSVYKGLAGETAVTILVQASPGKGRPPIVLRDISPGDVVLTVLPIVNQMRRPKGEPIELPL